MESSRLQIGLLITYEVVVMGYANIKSDGLEDVKHALDYLFMQRVFDDLDGEDRSGIHTSDVLDCLRAAYFNILARKEGIKSQMTQRDAITFWLGRIIHVLPISNVIITDYGRFKVIKDYSRYEAREEKMEISNGIERMVFMMYDKKTGERVGVWGHELPVVYCPLHDEDENADKWECILGRADELVFVPGYGIVLVDKKSASDIPKKPSERYVKQIEYYSVMIEDNWGIDVCCGAVLYIRKSYEEEWKHYVESIPFHLTKRSVVRNELDVRLQTLVRALRNGKPPAPEVNYFCGKCPHYRKCVSVGYNPVEQRGLDEFLK